MLGHLSISPHQVWLGSVCMDGRFVMRQTSSPDSGYIDITLNHFLSSNTTLQSVFSADSQHIYHLSKYGGGVTCVKWNISDSVVGRQKLNAGIASKKQRDNSIKQIVDVELQYLQTTHSIAAINYTPGNLVNFYFEYLLVIYNVCIILILL